MITENGWPSCTRAQCDDKRIPGTGETLPFQHGIPAIILPAIMADLNQYVESTNNSRGYMDEGSWTPTNSVKTSNHLGGTAFDYNWEDHPMGEELDGWHGSDIIHGEEEPEIRRILSFYTYRGIQIVWWANDWNSPKDSMHFQMGYNTYENQLIVWEFINKFIRPDGFSTYRRGGTGVSGAPMPDIDEAKLLGDAMGDVPGVDYDVLLPYVQKCLQMSDCTSDIRIDMWAAQVGHESVGLKYMKEIGDAAYFSKYNNRADLGNGPTDGPRYPGRGPIQVTGRNNYRKLSEWAFSQGYVPSPTYFEDRPEELERLEYAFLGTVWYWTVARPDINALSDEGDVVTVTHRINGGENGLADRTNRWNHCRQIDLEPLVEEDELSAEDSKRIRELHDRIVALPWFDDHEWPSLAWTRDEGDTTGDTVQTLRLALGTNIDLITATYAKDGVPEYVERIERLAAGDGPEGGNPQAVEWAKTVLEWVPEDARGVYKSKKA